MSPVEQVGAYPLNGCQGGVGVQVGLSPTDQIGLASLNNDAIETYQKNGITVDGPGSYGAIASTTITGDGPTPAIAQNGIQFSFGATGSVTRSTITGNNYTGTGVASSTGILVFGGGGSACGIGPSSPLVKYATFAGNRLIGNAISGAGYAPLGTLPNPTPPAFVRPIDVVSAPTINPQVSGNTYDGAHYNPS